MKKTGKTLEEYNKLINDFQVLATARIGYFVKGSEESKWKGRQYFEKIWYTFFGELANEARQIVQSNKKSKLDLSLLQKDLQKIVEVGLEEFRRRMDEREQ